MDSRRFGRHLKLDSHRTIESIADRLGQFATYRPHGITRPACYVVPQCGPTVARGNPASDQTVPMRPRDALAQPSRSLVELVSR